MASKSARLVVEAIVTRLVVANVKTKTKSLNTIDKLTSPAEGPLGMFVVFAVLTCAVAPRRLFLSLLLVRIVLVIPEIRPRVASVLIVRLDICYPCVGRSRPSPVAFPRRAELENSLRSELPVLIEPTTCFLGYERNIDGQLLAIIVSHIGRLPVNICGRSAQDSPAWSSPKILSRTSSTGLKMQP